ncbi:TerD family protein [Kitasatospora sp. NPDC054939]
MTHVMAKGANIALPVAAVRAVLRWSATPGGPDVDASALLLGPDNKVRSDADFVFYNQPRHPSGLVRHLPKQQLAGGAEIADTVEVELAKLPADVDKVILAGSSEGGSFRGVTGLRVLIHDAAAGEGAPPLAEFAVTDTDEVTALLAGELYRRAGAWKFRAVGQGYASGLIGLATDFGITVEDSAAGVADAVPRRPAALDPRAPRPEPGTFTLAPAVPLPTGAPQPSAAPPPPPAPPTVPPTAPPAPTAPPVPQPSYGYPHQAPQPQPQQAPAQGGYGYPPPAPQSSYGYPQPHSGQPGHPQQPQQSGYGYPPQQSGYGYPQQHTQQPPPPPSTPPTGGEEFALPPQGPQFQPR